MYYNIHGISHNLWIPKVNQRTEKRTNRHKLIINVVLPIYPVVRVLAQNLKCPGSDVIQFCSRHQYYKPNMPVQGHHLQFSECLTYTYTYVYRYTSNIRHIMGDMYNKLTVNIYTGNTRCDSGVQSSKSGQIRVFIGMTEYEETVRVC